MQIPGAATKVRCANFKRSSDFIFLLRHFARDNIFLSFRNRKNIEETPIVHRAQ